MQRKVCNFLNVILISHSLVLFMHVSPSLMFQSVDVVWCWLLLLGENVCVCVCMHAYVCVCACLCLSDPVFLSSLQSFSLHLVLIRTNTVEVSGWTAAFTLSPCACSVLSRPYCILMPSVCISCPSCLFQSAQTLIGRKKMFGLCLGPKLWSATGRLPERMREEGQKTLQN